MANSRSAICDTPYADDQQTIDYGYVTFGENKSFTIKVTDTGTGPLRFKDQPYVEVLKGC